jgi:SAM-dependent methyltransferase
MKDLESTRQFWNSSPCGGQPSLVERRTQRYIMEPWLPAILSDLAQQEHIVEVGSGQGTDAIEVCSQMKPGGRYLGLDYSDSSVEVARKVLKEEAGELPVTPTFQVGNAEALPMEDNSVPCIYSMGVLHHSADTTKTVSEIHRVMTADGQAHIFLYNCFSPKVSIAKSLRLIQHLTDRALNKNRFFYGLVDGLHMERIFGTMLLECFGVPFMRCYSKRGMTDLFSQFKILKLVPMGYNIPWVHRGKELTGKTPIGVFWYVVAQKK